MIKETWDEQNRRKRYKKTAFTVFAVYYTRRGRVKTARRGRSYAHPAQESRRAQYLARQEEGDRRIMFAKCGNCGRQAIAGIRDQRGTFCSTICRDYVAHPGFCTMCIGTSTPTSAGLNITFNGIGGMFYGSRDQCKTCGSVVRNQWFCIFFIPIFRVGRYRVKYVTPNQYLSREIRRKANVIPPQKAPLTSCG